MTHQRPGRLKTALAALAFSATVFAGAAGTAAGTPQPEHSVPAPVTTTPMEEQSQETDLPATEGTEGDDRDGAILVPDWMLLLIAVAVVVASVTLATQSYLRFTQTRKDLEG